MNNESNINNQKKQFCSECGHELLPNIKFCSNCGTKINQSIEPTHNIYSQNDYQNNQFENTKTSPKNKVMLIAVTSALICLLNFFLIRGLNIISLIMILIFLIALTTIVILIILPRKYQSDDEHGGLNFLSVLFPIIGFIFYFTWYDNKPCKAKGIIRNAITGMILSIILSAILIIIINNL